MGGFGGGGAANLIPGIPAASLGDAFQFRVMLQKTEDLEINVPLQLFVHFDSSVIQFYQFNSFVGEPSGYTIKSEQESQADNDTETDRVIEIKWPHNQFQSKYIYPESICSLAYTVINLNGSISDEIITKINFSTSIDYTCDTHSVSVKNLDFSYDIDGNGKVDALTDGLLLLYYMADKNQAYVAIWDTVRDIPRSIGAMHDEIIIQMVDEFQEMAALFGRGNTTLNSCPDSINSTIKPSLDASRHTIGKPRPSLSI
ncbi:hypothetical protein MHK_000022 [Candidatus Magnetomorum sp. HK-1]|nr:hypothetical protein MHK_000022 [Candidatus Magnetomorum sp. HK-1]